MAENCNDAEMWETAPPFIDFNSYYSGYWAGHDCGRWTSEEVTPGGRNTGKMAEKFE